MHVHVSTCIPSTVHANTLAKKQPQLNLDRTLESLFYFITESFLPYMFSLQMYSQVVAETSQGRPGPVFCMHNNKSRVTNIFKPLISTKVLGSLTRILNEAYDEDFNVVQTMTGKIVLSS